MEHRNQLSSSAQQEKEGLENQVKSLTSDLNKIRDEKANLQKQKSESESKVESLNHQVKDLMTDACKLREQVSF